ncbi:MAG: hypothetical protein J6U39_03870 [Clostridia bacterium]|nr:hypothetical protein [Clostridia bacterium]
MELIKLNVDSRCDMHLCRHRAEYRVSTGKGGLSAVFGTAGIYLCHDCLVKLYEAIGKELVPKSPDNVIKKAIKRREGNER